MSKKEQRLYKNKQRKNTADRIHGGAKGGNRDQVYGPGLDENAQKTVLPVDKTAGISSQVTGEDYNRTGFDSEQIPENPLAETIQQKLDNGETVNNSQNGIFHTPLTSRTLNFKKAHNELVFENEGSYIVLGTDRPQGTESGYGAKGSDRANSIDLVVGRMASAKGGEGPKQGTFVDNSFFADAARIYISQLTDIDKNFGLAETNTEQSVGRSGIAIKADAVRVIGREGIKIVTGRADGVSGYGQKGETNSLGGKIGQPAPTIDLIAGNNTSDRKVWGGLFKPVERIPNLQPAVKGYLTRDALRDLGEVIDEMWSALYTLTLTQVAFNGVLGADPFRPWVPAGAAAATTAQIAFVMNSLYHTRVNKNMWEFNYLYPFGYKYICSRNVNIT